MKGVAYIMLPLNYSSYFRCIRDKLCENIILLVSWSAVNYNNNDNNCSTIV